MVSHFISFIDRPAETPLSGAARRLHDDLRDKHNGEIYYDKLIKYYDYHECFA